MKIYTKTGDAGETALLGGVRVPKDDARVDAYGNVDELNSVLGRARADGPPVTIDGSLERVQSELFTLGAWLACAPGKEVALAGDGVGAEHVETLEAEIDAWEAELPQLTNFILPAGAAAAASLHVARTICRRAERSVVGLERAEPSNGHAVAYLNRLADWLFVAARLANLRAGVPDVEWRPMESAAS